MGIRTFSKYIAAFLIVSLCAGCLALPWSRSVEVVPKGNGEEKYSYRLGANDRIRIQVFGEDDLTTESKISGQGKIKYPLLGELDIGGKTVKEVEEYITQQLRNGYLNDPKVTVNITEYRNFFVYGEAKNPGAYPFREGLTLLKAITLAGGFTQTAAKGRMEVIRKVNGEEKVLRLEMDDLLQPDDIISIPQSFF